MSKQSDDSDVPNIGQVREEAHQLLEEIKQLRATAEEHLLAAKDARSKADSEALFAFNAKGACEGHSTAIANLKGKVEAEVNSIVTNKQKSDETLATITVAKATCEADTKAINESRKQIQEGSSEIIESVRKVGDRLQEVAESKKSVDALLTETKQLRDAATQARTKTEAAQTEAQEFSTSAAKLTADIKVAQGSSVTQSAEIREVLATVKVDRGTLSKIIEELTKSNDVATVHAKRVNELEAELKVLLGRVEGLLPGATSASLASAFGDQKKRFSTPRFWWMITFIICVVLLVAIGIPGFIAALSIKASDLKWEEVLLRIVIRLPIVIPLVWLAIYAGRNYMMGLRIEEDYAYKEAISYAFEGYRREMKEIGAGDATNPSPLTTLCANILRAIAERPGRIYEGKPQDITLLSELKATVEQVADLRQKPVASK